MRKQYYKCLFMLDNEVKIDYWHTNKPMMIINKYDFIIPLGTHKPRNVATEDIKQG